MKYVILGKRFDGNVVAFSNGISGIVRFNSEADASAELENNLMKLDNHLTGIVEYMVRPDSCIAWIGHNPQDLLKRSDLNLSQSDREFLASLKVGL